MNTTDVKRIIAREGLIIIAVLMLLGAMLVLEYRERDKRRSFEKTAKIGEIVEPSPNVTEKPTKNGGTFFTPTGIYVMVQKPMDLIRMDETLRRDFPKLRDPQFIEWDDQDRSVSIKHYYDSSGSRVAFTDYGTAVVLVILLYPVYWLVRFVLWSIHTLRQ